MLSNKQPLICIIGPTACGKTDLSIALAKKINGVCINTDATQFFEGLDQTTNKITEDEKQGIEHKLFSFLDLGDSFSVADYQKKGIATIDNIFQQNKIPILVGGSGLYINSLIYNYQFSNISKLDKSNLEAVYEKLTNEELYKLLLKIDSTFESKIHVNNRKQIISNLIYYKVNHKTKLSPLIHKKKLNYNTIVIYLKPDREDLLEKIKNRVDEAIKKGLIEEVEMALAKTNSNFNLQSMKIIGCKTIYDHLNDQISLEEAKEELVKANWHYARKQLIWFNRQIKHDYVVEYRISEFNSIKKELVTKVYELLKKN